MGIPKVLRLAAATTTFQVDINHHLPLLLLPLTVHLEIKKKEMFDLSLLWSQLCANCSFPMANNRSCQCFGSVVLQVCSSPDVFVFLLMYFNRRKQRW